MTAETVEAGVQVITPSIAEQWLGKNKTNRNVRERLVAAYARDMQAGRWRLSGESIKFALDGRLIDGQHRLQAVVRSGVPVTMLVVRGLDEDVMDVLDSGASRTAGDALRLRGESDYSLLASAARLCLQYESGKLSSNNEKVTHSEILQFVESNKDLVAAVRAAGTYRHPIDVPPSVVALAVWQLNRIDAEDCARFFNRLAEKTNLSKGDPILALLNRLSEVRRNNRNLDRPGYLSLIFRAWNYWRSHKTVQSLPISTQGEDVNVPPPR